MVATYCIGFELSQLARQLYQHLKIQSMTMDGVVGLHQRTHPAPTKISTTSRSIITTGEMDNGYNCQASIGLT